MKNIFIHLQQKEGFNDLANKKSHYLKRPFHSCGMKVFVYIDCNVQSLRSTSLAGEANDHLYSLLGGKERKIGHGLEANSLHQQLYHYALQPSNRPS